jgi:hypothetical protein
MSFTVSGGKILDPAGKSFIAAGINVYDSMQTQVMTTINGTPALLYLFPGLNFVRLATYSYHPPTYFQTFVTALAALKVVVEIEHHSGAGGGVQPLTGQDLIDECNWFSSLAVAFKDNPYVWFGTLNEPGGDGSLISMQQTANYNAIRDAGNNSPIMMEVYGDYNTGQLVVGAGHGLTTSSYAGMHGIIWDFHVYNGLPHFTLGDGISYSTNPSQLDAMIANYIGQCQTIRSADGIVPVIIGEYGPATDGQNVDPGGTQTVSAVLRSGFGSAAWNWQSGAAEDNLTDGNNNLTPYGVMVAAGIAVIASSQPTGGPSPVVTSPSPDNTVILAGSTASIIDAGGNVWTITSGGQVAVGGVADTTTSGVTELAYVGGTVWQKNATLWWGKITKAASWLPAAGTATSPIPVIVLPPANTPTHITIAAKLDAAMVLLTQAKADLAGLKP